MIALGQVIQPYGQLLHPTCPDYPHSCSTKAGGEEGPTNSRSGTSRACDRGRLVLPNGSALPSCRNKPKQKPREPQNTTKNTATQEHTNPKKRQNNQNTAIVSAKQTKPRTQSPELGQFLCSCRPSDRWQTTNQTNHHHAANTPHHKKPTKPTQYNNQFKSKTGAMGCWVHHTAGNT